MLEIKDSQAPAPRQNATVALRVAQHFVGQVIEIITFSCRLRVRVHVFGPMSSSSCFQFPARADPRIGTSTATLACIPKPGASDTLDLMVKLAVLMHPYPRCYRRFAPA